MLKWVNRTKKETKSDGRLFHDGHRSLIAGGKGKTLMAIINHGGLVIGAYEPFMKDPGKVFKDLQCLKDNGGMERFANNKCTQSKRGPIALGPFGADCKKNKEMLKEHAPSLFKFVEHVEEAYKGTGKRLTGLWWTYYRKDVGKTEVVCVPLGTMKPHRDQLSNASDRVIATFGANPSSGKHKRMSFHYKGDKSSKVWIKVFHGMFVCLSEEASGYRKFGFANTHVLHGVECAENTWTLTMEFTPIKK